MPQPPTVSVIIPTYNSAPYVAEALESVLAQTYPAHEIIVVDDGSTDNTNEVLRPYRDRIVYLRQTNSGAATARNTGLDQARGEWVAFLDSDDVWVSDKLERQVALASQSREYVCVYSWLYLFGDCCLVPERPVELLAGQYDIDLLITTPVVHPSAAMVRREAPVRFPTWGEPSEDMIYFAELCLLGRFGFIDAPLTGYRKRSGSVTKKPGNAVRSIEVRERWIREHAKDFGTERSGRLLRALFQSLAAQTTLAKWRRDWPRYWTLRDYLKRAWPWPAEGLPPVTTERIYPRIVYRLKDVIDSLRSRYV